MNNTLAKNVRDFKYDDFNCNKCKYWEFCNPCPMAFEMETGVVGIHSLETCRHAKIKYKVFKTMEEKI